MGSDNGVTSFDSHVMHALTRNDGLADSDILVLDQDSKGRIWFLSYNGKLSYWKNDQIYNESNNDSLKSIEANANFLYFFEDSKKNIWFGTKEGLYRIDSSGSILYPKELNPSHPKHIPQKLSACLLERKGCVYSVGLEGVLKVSDEKGNIEKTFPLMPFDHRYDNNLRATYSVNRDALYTAEKNKVFAMSFDKLDFIWKIALPGVSFINGIELLKDNLLYLATDNGVFVLNKEGVILQQYLLNQKTSDVLIDRENNLWISTLDNGVFLIRESQILNYECKAKYAAIEVGDSILFGGENAEIEYIKNNKLRLYKIDFRNLSVTSQNQNKIRQFAKSKKGQLYLGTDYGLFALENNEALLTLPFGIKSFLFQENNAYLSLATGCLKFKQENLEEFKQFFQEKQYNQLDIGISWAQFEEDFTLNNHTCTNCFFKREKVSNYSNAVEGVFYINFQDRITSNQDFSASLISKLEDKQVVSILQTKEKKLWILGKNGSLSYYDVEKDSLANIEGLPKSNGEVYSSMTLDENNMVWIGSNSGLFHTKLKGGAIQIQASRQNYELLGKEINDIFLRKDTLWLATSTGISSFPIYQDWIDTPPLFYIDSVVVDHQSVCATELLNLTSDQNSLEVSVSAISYKTLGQLTLNYRLIGDELEEGTFSGRKLILNDLAPSDYKLQLYASNLNGISSEQQEFHFSIHTVWWKSYQFWLLVIIFIIVIAIGTAKFLLKKRVQEVQQFFDESQEKFILVKSVGDNSDAKILLHKLCFAKGAGDYVELYLNNGKRVVVRSTMKKLLADVGLPEFIRVHNSYIVNMKHVTNFKFDELKILGMSISISRANREKVKAYYRSMEKEN